MCKIPVTNISSLFSRKEKIFTWLGNTSSALKNAIVNPGDRNGYASLAFLGSMLPAASALKNGASLLLIGSGVIIGSLAGIKASKLARIQNGEAALLGAMLVTAIVVNSNELAAMSFNDFMQSLTETD